MPNLVMRFDMRNLGTGATNADLYQAAIDMAVWADQKGFDAIQMSEHHGSEDGYIPSPAILMAAIAARTSRVKLRFGITILPLHSPIRLAEDLAVLDILSGGRVVLGVGAGYAPHEFEMFGVDLADRAKLMEEGIQAIKDAWTGEPFTYRGRRARVTPKPLQQPRPPIWMGGASPGAAKRAAKIADYFYTGEKSHYDIYRQAAIELGSDPGPFRDIGTGFFVVADDIEHEWARMGQYIAHEVNSYAKWAHEGYNLPGAFKETEIAAIRQSGGYPILTKTDAIEYARARSDLSVHPLISGTPPEIGWDQLRRFEREVLPHIKGR